MVLPAGILTLPAGIPAFPAAAGSPQRAATAICSRQRAGCGPSRDPAPLRRRRGAGGFVPSDAAWPA